MSLILEALRKSEAERRRGQAPDVAMELPPTPTSRPRALATWLLPALVMTAVLVLAGWWAKRAPENTESPGAAIEATDAPRVQDAPVPALAPRIETRAALPVVNTSAPGTTTTVVPVPVAASTPAPVLVVAVPRPAPIKPMPAAPTPARPLPPAASEVSNDTSTLPPIKLSMLMWDEVPSRRFVIINGQHMSEGDRNGGIAVIAIERGGVVVESNGNRARVPLP